MDLEATMLVKTQQHVAEQVHLLACRLYNKHKHRTQLGNRLIVEKANIQIYTAMDEEQTWQFDSKSHKCKKMYTLHILLNEGRALRG